jgi:hypothetical protein
LCSVSPEVKLKSLTVKSRSVGSGYGGASTAADAKSMIAMKDCRDIAWQCSGLNFGGEIGLQYIPNGDCAPRAAAAEALTE